MYSLRPILLFANIDVFRHILVLNTSVLAKSNMNQMEYYYFCIFKFTFVTKGFYKFFTEDSRYFFF
jgi:hypothetical protein